MEQARRDQPRTWRRWEPLTGVGFIALFVAGLVINNSPSPDESNATWHNYFADKGHQALITIDGFMLVASGICLLAFLTTIWQRIGARRGAAPSPLPVVGAGVAATAIMIGGVVQAAVTGSMIFGNLPEPGPDVLRLAPDIGYPVIMVAAMPAAALSIVALSVQAYAAGLFGRRLLVLGEVVAVGLLASVLFVPMVLLPVWAAVIATVLLRRGADADAAAAIEERLSAQLSGTATRAPNGAATPAPR
jgi:hypothetical protein